MVSDFPPTPTRRLPLQSATPATGSSKYGSRNKSFLNLSDRKLPKKVAEELEELGRHGLANKTWSSYATAERLLFKFHKDNNLKPDLPISEETALRFIHWLATVRNLKAGTINTYLAGVRQLHIAKGLPEPNIRTNLVNLILKGLQNRANTARRGTQTHRKPITKDTMAILKRRLRSWETSPTNRRLLWAVATNLFHGAFRIGELLCSKSSEFDPHFELTTDDIHTSQDSNQFRLNAPKEDRKGKSIIVDVFSTGGPNCPVHALQKWKALHGHWPAAQPAFRWDNGKPLTQNQFRKIMKQRLTGFIENPEDVFCTHSFRIGIASMLGTLGYSDDDVKAVGRWSSRAFEEYLLLPRTKRMQIARQVKL